MGLPIENGGKTSSLHEITRGYQFGFNYPVVNGGSDKRSELGVPIFPIYSFSEWGASWSYLEFPNHLIVTGFNVLLWFITLIHVSLSYTPLMWGKIGLMVYWCTNHYGFNGR